MTLFAIAQRLERRLLTIQGAIDQSFSTPQRRLPKWALQDGYLSQAWQQWCWFCREIIFASVAGTTTTKGVVTSSPLSGLSVAELGWIGMRAAQGHATSPVKAIAAKRLEPTWGDATKFQAVVTAFSLTNELQVLSGVFSAGPIVRHMQIIRNASAHTNSETMAEVRTLSASYIASPITMPGDAIFWGVPATGDFVYREWTSRLIAAAKLAAE